MRKFAPVLVGILLAAGTFAQADAGMSSGPAGHVRGVSPHSIQLKDTAVAYSSLRVTKAAGFNTLDTQTMKCKSRTTCTIVIDSMVQVEELSPYWAICLRVDGLDVNAGCNWQGLSSSSSSVYVTGNAQGSLSVGPGDHTVETTVYLSVAGATDNWHTTYHVYRD